MSAESPALVATFAVGHRRVTLTIPTPRRGAIVCMTCEWSPDLPHRLNRREMRQYRRGRDAAVADLARRLRKRAITLEV